jgi:rhodanese-related sulfurtransferase
LAGAVLAMMLLLPLAACGDGDEAVDQAATTSAAAEASIRVVDPEVAFELVGNPPEALTIIDVRTPEEFGAGHLADAVLIDIYRDDFTQQLDALDRTTPYLIYCRSGNRSEQARQIMVDLGFSDVTDIAGGYQAWEAAGHPTVQ